MYDLLRARYRKTYDEAKQEGGIRIFSFLGNQLMSFSSMIGGC